MGRQLFLHHYLPAHLASSLVAGGLLDFVFTAEPVLDGAAVQGQQAKHEAVAGAMASLRRHMTAKERMAGQSLVGAWITCSVLMALLVGGWYFFLPLTYGYPGLSVDQVLMRKWLGYDLHFAK